MALTHKQEAFCQAVVSGLSQADAYRKAYNAEKMSPPTVQKRASELMRKDGVVYGVVTGRIAELRRPVVEKLQYGLEQAMSEADRAIALSEFKENPGAMVNAITLRAKLNGLLVERREVKTGPMDGAPVSELLAMQQAIDAIRRARESA